ncbi:uncharacterized protein C5L36_0E04150 [Pichia kudriavzevii]|uniref:Large ribosomal subunit protein bL28m n=1 Tax=Pichia kudriavzevii TaxID=4909 RepID=A0A1V2LIL5_PICKU|nr:uncharacterized protein C5L36_0E04150 [Pichia kudriavzevii]AWU78360.1 hypothetical protein C5L36_0E04150 [Pichia kudriavzevii]ONH72347.1 hypothetical protein BOH78_3873 [Pichia kudriavzevii]
MDAFRGVIKGVRGFSTTVCSSARAYKSVVNRQLKKTPEYKVGDPRSPRLWVPKEISKYPAYPYGESRLFKRSDRGLYGGQVVSFGNKVSEMGNRSRRSWLPNAIVKSLWSESLNKVIKMRLTARVLRTITKEGGLDNYLTKDKQARIKELGLFGWRLRHDVLKARALAKLPPRYQVFKKEDGSEVKVYFDGEYQGQPVKLTIGKRKLLQQLFPAVKNNTVGNLSFASFNVGRANKDIGEIMAECEKLNVDLKNYIL